MFSRRTAHDPTPNHLGRAVADARREGRIRSDLTCSNPTDLGLGFSDATIRAATEGLALDRYHPDPRGSLATRAAFGAVLGLPAERVLLTASTSEAYSFVFATLADPGDRVLVPRPSYPLLEWLGRLSGVVLEPYDTVYDGEWHLDRDTLSPARVRDAKALVVVSPNNPTGAYLSADDRAYLAQLGLPLVVDEVFGEYPVEMPSKPVTEAAREGLVFRLTGLSKLAALPQAKLGCIGLEGDDALVTDAISRLELVADSFLSVSSAADLGAPRLIAASAAIRARIRARCTANLGALDASLAGTAASRLRVEGGWSVVVRMPGVDTEDAFVLALLDDGVVVQPGWFYDFTSGPYLVLSLLGDEAEFAFGARCIAACAERASSDARR